MRGLGAISTPRHNGRGPDSSLIAVFIKVGHGTFSLIIIIVFIYFRTDLLDVQHLENLMDSLENHSIVVVERSTF